MFERISVSNTSIIESYGNHIQRYQFASRYCEGRRVVDAGCGTGYGTAFLNRQGAGSVLAIDISPEAIQEATRLYARQGIRFIVGDVEKLAEAVGNEPAFDVVINFENLEHLHHPEQFIASAHAVLAPGGKLICSTPNGSVSTFDTEGRLTNPFHVKEYTWSQMNELIKPHFASIEGWGQWETPARKMRIAWEQELHETLTELYYTPVQRLSRALGSLLGRKTPKPPQFQGFRTCMAEEFELHPLELKPYPWEPDVLVAVCTK